MSKIAQRPSEGDGLTPLRVAKLLVEHCGIECTLDVGQGDRRVASELLKRGCNVFGVNVSPADLSKNTGFLSERFFRGTLDSLPFDDEAFETVYSLDCLQNLSLPEMLLALREIHRVVRRNVLLILPQDNGGRHRTKWEMCCFEAGFRKHPAHYRLNDYTALGSEDGDCCILLEKIPADIFACYPYLQEGLSAGVQEDRLRESSLRADVCAARYQWASRWIKPGDRVLDVKCGAGYGCHMLSSLTPAASVYGLDEQHSAVAYASTCYGHVSGAFEHGATSEALSRRTDGTFEVIVAFDVLNRVDDAQEMMATLHRLLSPGGRLIVSELNGKNGDMSVGGGFTPARQYGWLELQNELSVYFVVEGGGALTGDRRWSSAPGVGWVDAPRALTDVGPANQDVEGGEWWLIAAMKLPLGDPASYQERVFQNLSGSGHPSIRYAEDYANPWLMHSMVNSGYRIKNGAALEALADDIIASSETAGHDRMAALCVKSYRVLESGAERYIDAAQLVCMIDAALSGPADTPSTLRWRVSLLFVRAKLLQSQGRLEEAQKAFAECAAHDVCRFGIHLATKTTEAWYVAGRLAFALGDRVEAGKLWKKGIESGEILLSASLDDILINRDFPNCFNHGDGVREYAVAWDNIARCANGVHLLARGGPMNVAMLDNCQQSEYAGVTEDVIAVRSTLVERTIRLERVSAMLETGVCASTPRSLKRSRDWCKLKNLWLRRWRSGNRK